MKKIIACIIAAVCISGCSNNAETVKSKTLTCNLKSDIINIENIFTYEDKEENPKLLTQTTNTETNLENAAGNKDAIYEALESVKTAYDGIDGIEYTYKEENNMIYETTKVDFTKTTTDTLESLKIESNGEDSFNLEQFTEFQTKSGFTCE